MPDKTVSEKLFEDWCNLHKVQFVRVECGDGRTPDYDITLGDSTVVVEVKQADPNPEEKLAIKKAIEDGGDGGIVNHEPGKRVRKKINDAGPQLSRRSKGRFPSILVLYNNVKFFPPMRAYDVKVAMSGFEQVVFKQSGRPGAPLTVTDRKFGPGRKMTPEDNTSISAVALLTTNSGGAPTLSVFHNLHAAIPLDPCLLPKPMARQYVLGKKEDGEFQEWEEL